MKPDRAGFGAVHPENDVSPLDPRRRRGASVVDDVGDEPLPRLQEMKATEVDQVASMELAAFSQIHHLVGEIEDDVEPSPVVEPERGDLAPRKDRFLDPM